MADFKPGETAYLIEEVKILAIIIREDQTYVEVEDKYGNHMGEYSIELLHRDALGLDLEMEEDSS